MSKSKEIIEEIDIELQKLREKVNELKKENEILKLKNLKKEVLLNNIYE